MSHVLGVEARRLGDPLTGVVLMEPHDRPPDGAGTARMGAGLDQRAAGLADLTGPAGRVTSFFDHGLILPAPVRSRSCVHADGQ